MKWFTLIGSLGHSNIFKQERPCHAISLRKVTQKFERIDDQCSFVSVTGPIIALEQSVFSEELWNREGRKDWCHSDLLSKIMYVNNIIETNAWLDLTPIEALVLLTATTEKDPQRTSKTFGRPNKSKLIF